MIVNRIAKYFTSAPRSNTMTAETFDQELYASALDFLVGEGCLDATKALSFLGKLGRDRQGNLTCVLHKTELPLRVSIVALQHARPSLFWTSHSLEGAELSDFEGVGYGDDD